jgi:phosphoglycerate dehydrogenase-like enzyme
MVDAVEEAIVAGAIAALRRRADRQQAIAKSWTVHGERGTVVVSGEGRIAERIAAALEAAAEEIENGGTAS